MKKLLARTFIICCFLSGALCSICAQTNASKDIPEGAISPEDAIAYMEKTKHLIVVNVLSPAQYDSVHFAGSINIPYYEPSESSDSLFRALPADQPILIHCLRGRLAPKAYQHLKTLRPDIRELHYIAGAPRFETYNQWAEKQTNHSSVH